MRKKLTRENVTLAFYIALLPPVWAIIAQYIGNPEGSVALICAGIYVANGNKKKDAVKISIGFLLGDLWAIIATKGINFTHGSKVATFFILAILGAGAVLISELNFQYIFLPAWLCGWAIGMTIMHKMSVLGLLPVHIAISMLIGVWYVGAFLDFIQKKTCTIIERKKTDRREKDR